MPAGRRTKWVALWPHFTFLSSSYYLAESPFVCLPCPAHQTNRRNRINYSLRDKTLSSQWPTSSIPNTRRSGPVLSVSLLSSPCPVDGMPPWAVPSRYLLAPPLSHSRPWIPLPWFILGAANHRTSSHFLRHVFLCHYCKLNHHLLAMIVSVNRYTGADGYLGSVPGLTSHCHRFRTPEFPKPRFLATFTTPSAKNSMCT